MEKEDQLLLTLGIPAKLKQAVVGDFTINYLIAGSGPTVLLIHGANIGWGQWHKIIPSLASHFSVIAIDIPGSGGSTKFNYKKLDFNKHWIEPIESFLSQLNLSKISIIGHSVGGWIGAQLALRKKIDISNLILVHSIGFHQGVPLKQILLTLWPMAWFISNIAIKPTIVRMHKFLQSATHKKLNFDESFINYFHESIHRHQLSHPINFINALTKPFRLRPELFLGDKIKNLTIPSLILWGEYDPLIPVKKQLSLSRKIPGSKIEILHTGHVSFLEEPKKFATMVIQFLSNPSYVIERNHSSSHSPFNGSR